MNCAICYHNRIWNRRKSIESIYNADCLVCLLRRNGLLRTSDAHVRVFRFLSIKYRHHKNRRAVQIATFMWCPEQIWKQTKKKGFKRYCSAIITSINIVISIWTETNYQIKISSWYFLLLSTERSLKTEVISGKELWIDREQTRGELNCLSSINDYVDYPKFNIFQ